MPFRPACVKVDYDPSLYLKPLKSHQWASKIKIIAAAAHNSMNRWTLVIISVGCGAKCLPSALEVLDLGG